MHKWNWWVVVLVALMTPRLHAEPSNRIQILLKQYCGECHNKGTPKGDVHLRQFSDQGQSIANIQFWRTVTEQLADRYMPPSDARQPTDAERDEMLTWARGIQHSLLAGAPRDPGRIPIHRLNQSEYNNTIRDLVGVDIRPADSFPSDDMSQGFDNIAGVLNVSAILLERYLDAADRVLTYAIRPHADRNPISLNLLEQLKGLPGKGEGASLALGDTASVSVDVPYDGEYEIRIRAPSPDLGRGGVLGVYLGATRVRDMPVRPNETRNAEYVFAARFPAEPVELNIRFFSRSQGESLPAGTKLLVERATVAGPILPQSHKRIFFVTPSESLAPRDAAQQVLQRFASRAFRRPVTPAELEPLLQLYDEAAANGANFYQAVRQPLWSVLVNSKFLYRIEQDQGSPDSTEPYRINDWELACRLSYFLWSSMPDDRLFRLAEEGTLHRPEVLEKEVQRMLSDRKSTTFVENFFGQWLGLRALATKIPDVEAFPRFDSNLRRSLKQELLLFCEHLVRDNRSALGSYFRRLHFFQRANGSSLRFEGQDEGRVLAKN